MRIRIFLISLLALALSSCETYISLEELSPENALWVNSYISTVDSLHSVRIVMAGKSGYRTVSSAHLQAFVNGRLVDETDSLFDSGIGYNKLIKKMTFNADIAPGDELRLVIDADNQHVEVKETALEPVPIVSVDTSYVVRYSENHYSRACRKYSIRVNDRSGEANYYRIVVYLDRKDFVEEVERDPYSEKEPEHYPGEFLSSTTTELKLDNTSEPLLNKDVSFLKDPGSGIYNYFENKYDIFTDSGFKDGEYVFQLYSNEADERAYISAPYKVKVRVQRKIRVSLQTMSRDSYCYMDFLAYDESDQFGYYFPDVICPNNVKGGIGFVSIMSADEYVIELPDVTGYSYSYGE